MGAPDGGEDETVGADAFRREGLCHGVAEGGNAAFGAHEAEFGAIDRFDGLRPCFENGGPVFIGVVGGAEGDEAVALFGRAGLR